MVDRLLAGPQIVATSLPPELERGTSHYRNMEEEEEKELGSFPGGSRRASESDGDWLASEDECLIKRPKNSYGSLQENDDPLFPPSPIRRKIKGRRQYGRLDSTTVSSLTRIFSPLQDDDDESSEEEEEPPILQRIYRRSGKDLAKLILLPTLYFALMIVAIVFAFYTIEGLLDSYRNKVRSVQSVDVHDRYPPIGIAIMPKFADYHYCEYRYYDDVSPTPETPPDSCAKFGIPLGCTYHNVTFNSTALKGVQRFAMVFQGPTLVACKESILVHYTINTTVRQFSAMEYILFANWHHFESLDDDRQRSYLAKLERDATIYTFPAGFRTWVKMSYSVYTQNTENGDDNMTDFSIIPNYAAFNEPGDDGIFPLEIVFEWKDRYYDYVTEIVSTTAWSAFGSICGVFITLVKAGEFCRMWLRRIRRERQKKEAHLKQLEAEHEKQMREYEERQRERRETKLKKSLEATKSASINPRPINFYD